MFHVKREWFVCVLVGLCVGCPAPETGEQADAGAQDSGQVEVDTGGVSGEDAGADVGEDAGVDLGVDLGMDVGGEDAGGGCPAEDGLPTCCEGECAEHDVTATFGASSAPLELGFYGFNAPGEDGARSLYVELHGDASPQCPSQDSPTPGRTLVISGLPWPLEQREYTRDDGVTGSLLDFDGTLFDSPAPQRAATISVTPRAADACTECIGQPAPSDSDGFVAFDVEVTFEAGSLSGKARVTHCDSYDE